MSTPTPTKFLERFVGTAQRAAIWAGLHAEEAEWFRARLQALGGIVARMPATGETDGQGDAAIAWLRYFTPAGGEYLITELDASAHDGHGRAQAFGLADAGHGFPELGYIDLPALIGAGAELDLHFTPAPLRELRGGAPAPTHEPPSQPAAATVPAESGVDIVEALETGDGRLVLAAYDGDATPVAVFLGIESRLGSMPALGQAILALATGQTKGWRGRAHDPQTALDAVLDDPSGCRVIGRWFSGSGLSLSEITLAGPAGRTWAALERAADNSRSMVA